MTDSQSQNSYPQSKPSNVTSPSTTDIIFQLVFHAAALGGLYFIPAKELTELWFITIVMIIAVPIAIYISEYRIFARQAILDAGCVTGGFTDKFRKGGMIKVTSFLVALFLASILVALLPSLTKHDWIIICVASFLLFAAENTTFNRVARQFRGSFRPIAHRRLIHPIILIAVFTTSAVMFFYGSHQDFRDDDLAYLLEFTFHTELRSFKFEALGLISAIASTADIAMMYIAQNFVGHVEGTETKWLIWLYVTAKYALTLLIFVYVPLSVSLLCSIQRERGWRILGQSVSERYFTGTLLVLLCATASLQLWEPAYNSKLPTPESNHGECDFPAKIAAHENSELDAELKDEQTALTKQVEAKIESQLKVTFDKAEKNIDRYLNWHYSVVGEYQRLSHSALSALGTQTRDRYVELVLNPVKTSMNELHASLDNQVSEKLIADAKALGKKSRKRNEAFRCAPTWLPTTDTLEAGFAYVGHPQLAIGAGAIGVLATKKAAAKAGAKVAGKLLAKLTGAITVASGGVVCGPLAPLCGAAGAVAGWFTVDAVVTTLDEFLTRDELRNRLVAKIQGEGYRLDGALRAYYQMSIQESYESLNQTYKIPEQGISQQ